MPGPTGTVKRRVDKAKSDIIKLAQPDDPLIGPDGRLYGAPTARHEVETVKVNPVTFRPLKKRSLKEMPAQPAVLNGVACIFLYTMMGLSDREIADTLRITILEVEGIRKHTAYAECFDDILNTFINSNSEILQSRIASYSHSALSQVADLMLNGEKEETRLRASTDVLDRAGARPQDNITRQQRSMTGLRIVIVDGEARGVEINVEQMQ